MTKPAEPLTIEQVVEYFIRAGLSLTALTLVQYRYIEKGPRFIKSRGHFVRYRTEDLDAYLAERDAEVAS